MASDPQHGVAAARSVPDASPLAGHRILLVEDDFLVGCFVQEALEEYGATVLGPVGSVPAALAYIAEHEGDFDHAVLDLDLHGVKSYPVADALARARIPFLFATGYDSDSIDPAYRRFPHCVKPVSCAALLSAFRQM